MPPFHVAFTGDFLDENSQPAYGDSGALALSLHPKITTRYLTEYSPQPGAADFWQQFYSMEITPDALQGVNGLVVLRPWIRSSAFAEGAEDLVAIGRSGAGYDKIDIDACTENDVVVFNAPLALNHSTASSALTFMLALAKRLPAQDRVVREGRWERQASVLGDEIQGRTLGIIGLGHSGRELVRLVAPFEMQILAYSPHADPAQAEALGVRLTTLEETLSKSDFVSLHCRLTPQTRGMIGARELELLRPTTYFINVARGELVNQAALTNVLKRGQIAGAALDVFDREPLPANDPLTSLENVILAPHWSASTRDVWRATAQAMSEGMLRVSRGDLPYNVINESVIARRKFQQKLTRYRANDGRE